MGRRYLKKYKYIEIKADPNGSRRHWKPGPGTYWVYVTGPRFTKLAKAVKAASAEEAVEKALRRKSVRIAADAEELLACWRQTKANELPPWAGHLLHQALGSKNTVGIVNIHGDQALGILERFMEAFNGLRSGGFQHNLDPMEAVALFG